MHAYFPKFWGNIAIVFAIIGVFVLMSVVINKMRKVKGYTRIFSWGVFIAFAFFVHFLCMKEPPGVRMVLLCFVLLYSMKLIIITEYRISGKSLPPLMCLLFVTLWPGMNPGDFEQRRQQVIEGKQLIIKGLVRCLCGGFFIILARFSWITYNSYIIATFFLLPGISLILHFGIVNIAAGILKCMGANSSSQFRAPLFATSLSEFWGKRWNVAFSEMTKIAVYHPLSQVIGKKPAAIIGFLLSGAIHELAISVPVNKGYGLPSCYFLLHGILIVIERTLYTRGKAIDSYKWLGRIWTVFWLLLPIPILFHIPFLKGVIWPLIGIG